MGAIQAGLEIVAAVEFDKNAAETYKKNIIKAQKTAVKIHKKNVLEIKPEDLADKKEFGDHGCDLVLGGPPCQGFSVHRINNAGVDDARNELILHYFKFVSALRSKYFLMENVPGILWERHKEYIDDFYKAGEAAGYLILPPITLDARNYGIPQRRKRVFILGVRKDLGEIPIEWPPRQTHGDDSARKKDDALLAWVPASTVFEQPLNGTDENNIHLNHTPRMVDVFRSTPLNGGSRHESNRVLPCHLNHNGHKDVYGRIDPALPGPTMTTACVNPSKGRFLHPTEHHGITVRHAARFQTFPEWFTFTGGIMASAKQVGNAVPVRFGEILVSKIKLALDNYYTNKRK